MKRNPQTIERVRMQLKDALSGLEGYLDNWPTAPKDFTTTEELQRFIAKLCEMLESLERDEKVPILGMWRIMETWPYKNDLRKKIVEAELSYERLI
jgi:hypothetical protein